MTDPTRGARIRRGARRPGWILTTALLVLAIAASSALVFTNRVELLKLAVILALWAAVVAAFVSVIYRRQSDTDQAKVRDLKLVYDLQLEREISARREYELSVESHLRRELAAELRAQSADEVAALRAELAALRANLEYLFDADLSHRPAIETDRAAAQSFTEWGPRPDSAGRVRSSRIDTEETAILDEIDEHSPDTEESPIIDVPAEPHPPEDAWPPADEPAGGAHRRAGAREPGPAPWALPPPPETPPPPPQFPWLPPQAPPPAPPEPAPEPEPAPSPAAAQSTPAWQPAPAEGRYIPAGEPGSNWVAPPANGTAPEYVGRRRAPDTEIDTEPEAEPPRGRHSSAAETPDPEAEPVPEDTDDDRDGGAHTGGQSVAELLARLQATPSGGGRRRRRED
ncbi:hypothetical protein ASG82_09395 [Mycobacterium sp. Soil538]|nr:hypothetical protein ASG82_09395 [Mycobacterium sp. Soil538]